MTDEPMTEETKTVNNEPKKKRINVSKATQKPPKETSAVRKVYGCEVRSN